MKLTASNGAEKREGERVMFEKGRFIPTETYALCIHCISENKYNVFGESLKLLIVIYVKRSVIYIAPACQEIIQKCAQSDNPTSCPHS